MVNCLRHPIRERFLPKALMAVDIVLWLFWLPVMLRLYTVPILLKRLAQTDKHIRKTPLKLKDAVGIVTYVCSLRPFRSRFFPKQCLRQSLALYRTLCQMGYAVEIHFGVMKDSRNFHGHSWVTMQGEPVADTARSDIFKIVYSYPPAGSSLPYA